MAPTPLKVCFLLKDLGLSGGVGVVVQHAGQLARRHGAQVTIALTYQGVEDWAYAGLEGVRCVPVGEAARDRYDIALCTWWETAYHLFSVPADRYAYFAQNLEDRLYPDQPAERASAQLTHELPVTFVTEAQWIVATLAERRPDAACHLVANGIDKQAFACPDRVPPRPPGPLRILIEGHPGLWVKAVKDSVAAASMMTRPRFVTLVTPEAGSGKDLAVDRAVGPLSRAQMASAYEDTDVVLKLSRVEGMFGPPLEGFHKGATCVVTPVTGHDQFVRHRWNGIVADWDDLPGTARWLDLLAGDDALLAELRANALATAREWPSWEAAGDRMAEVLEEIIGAPSPLPDDAAKQTIKTIVEGAGQIRDSYLELAADRHAVISERNTMIRDRDAHIAGLEAQIGALKETSAYRTGVFLRDKMFKRLPFWRST